VSFSARGPHRRAADRLQWRSLWREAGGVLYVVKDAEAQRRLTKKPAISRAPPGAQAPSAGGLREAGPSPSLPQRLSRPRWMGPYLTPPHSAHYKFQLFLRFWLWEKLWIFATVTVAGLQSARRDSNPGPPAFLGRAHARHGDCPLLARGRLEVSSLAASC